MQFKKIIALFGASSILLVILRTVQLLTFVDASTGFTKSDRNSSTFSTLFTIIYLAIGAFIYYLAYYSCRRQPTKAPDYEKAPALPIGIFAFCVYFALNTARAFLNIRETICLIQAIFGILSIICILIYAIYIRKNKVMPALLALTPAIYFIVTAIKVFLNFSKIATITENVIHIIFLCFAIIFFQLNAKIMTGITLRRACRLILPTGLITFMLSCILILPTFIISLIGKSNILHAKLDLFNLSYLLVGIYALIYTLSLYNFKKSNNKKRVVVSSILNSDFKEVNHEDFIRTKDYQKPQVEITEETTIADIEISKEEI